MTMIITMIRPEGVWQTADNRVTVGGKLKDDITPKQLHLVCPPLDSGPQVLLGFTGLAEFSDGTPTLQWIRETLRGESRVIMSMFDHLRDRLTRDVGTSSLWQNQLVLSGGIFEGQKRFYVEMRNLNVQTRRPMRQFEYAIYEVTQPMIFIGGSGQYSVAKENVDLLMAQANIRPAKWEDHLGLLAAVNRRTAKRTKTVSPWCQASFLGNDRQGAFAKRFARYDEPTGPVGTETIIAGIDLSEVSKIMMEHSQRMMTDPTAPIPDTNEASHRSIEGRQ